MNKVLDKLNIAYSYEYNDKVFILSNNGNSLLLDKELFKEIKNNQLSDALKYKLKINSFFSDDRYDIRKDKIIPAFFMIDFSTQCNLGCYYCLRDFISHGSVIKHEELVPILEKIKNYTIEKKLDYITIQPWGGEPLISYKEILYMDDYFKSNNINARIVIQTNGTLITKEMADEMCKRGISVAISLDGNETIQNLHRKYLNGRNSYQDVIKGLNNLQEYYGNVISTISVITKMSNKYIEDSLTTMAKDLHIKKVKFNFVHPNSDAFPLDSVFPLEEIGNFYDRLISTLIKLNKEGYVVTDMNVYDRIINLFKGWNGELCHSNGCLGGYKFVTFARNGDIYPCELVGNEELKIANINDGEIDEVISKSISNNNPYFSLKHDEKCNDCPWKQYCRGGCMATSISYNDKYTSIDKYQCAINSYLYPKLIKLALEDKEAIKILSLGEVILDY